MKPPSSKSLTRLTPAAMVFFVACATPPEGTNSLTDDQREDVQKAIEEAEQLTPAIVDILSVADPLFDLEGNPVQDNRVLQEGVANALLEVQGIWEADRILSAPLEYHDNAAALAHGALSDVEGDDYIILILDEEGRLYPDASTLMHEGLHYYSVNHPAEMRSELDADEDRDRTELALEYNDAPYLVGELYDALAYGLADATHFVPETVESLIEYYQNQGESNQSSRDQSYESLLRYNAHTREEWADLVARTSGPSLDTMDRLGVTREEFRDVMVQQDALYETYRSTVREALESWHEAFPEYNQEAQAERQMAMRRAQR